MRSKISFEKLELLIILALSLIGSYWMWHKLVFIQHSHFTDLAYSLIHGKLALFQPVSYSSWQDAAYFKGDYYVYFGPVPALLLIPLVVIWGQATSQQILVLIAGIINFFLALKIGMKLGLKLLSAVWVATAFIFGSVYLFLTLVNISAYLVQVVGFTFILLAVWMALANKSWLLIGFSVALAGLTRLSLYFSLPFFLLEIFQVKSIDKIKKLFLFAIPVILSLGFYGTYNYLRFGSFFDTGYTYNTTWPPGVKEAVEYGLFSVSHIPGNLYFLLFKSPEAVRISEVSYVLRPPFLKASEWGMGIFYTSPIFLYIFASDLKKKLTLSSLIGTISGLIPSLTYAGVGVWQFGYRYALDVYPFLLVLLCLVLVKKGVSSLTKIAIVYSIAFNLYLLGSMWGIYP